VIEDEASIGSNCVLVAPVKISRGATIGGGSTIAKEAPADALTVARAPQVSVPGWKRPSRNRKPQRADAMCGIVGAVSPRNVVPVLIDGIRPGVSRLRFDRPAIIGANGSATLERLVSTARVADLAAQASATQLTGSRASRTPAGRRTARRRP
jgi:hypothetical protein